MAGGYMNERCREILDILLKSENYLSLQKIADMLHISRRSIYYDICRINEWLEENGIAELETVRGKGIFIDQEKRAAIKKCTTVEEQRDSYILAPMERVNVIICFIIYADQKIYIEQLMEECTVSRNTIFNDMRIVVSQLQAYDLKLEYESKKGYFITGDAIRIRAMFLAQLHELETAMKSGALHFIDEEKTNGYVKQLKEIENRLRTKYVEGTLWSLAALMPVMERGRAKLYFPNLKKEELQSTREYQLVKEYFPEFEENEQIYLSLHLLGARVAVVSNDIFESHPNQTVYEITKALVAEFERIACVNFENREDLERALFIHINASLYRYQFGIQTADVMSEDIIREYPDLFEITKVVSRYIEKYLGMPIPDGEVAYLALHFGSRLSVAGRDHSAFRILIVCANGISTGYMLKRELQKMLPSVEIAGVYASSSVQNIQNICDIVISTVPFKSVVPVIQVHPILTEQEREQILNHPKIRKITTGVSPEKIFDIVSPYVKKQDYVRLKTDLWEYFAGTQARKAEKMKLHQGLLDVLEEKNIGIHNEKMSWMQAILETGKCLKENGNIENRYLEEIISQIRYYGPYMFIVPGVALAHAKPEDGVKKLGLSLHIFREQIDFSDFHKANIILLLAAEDQESHLKVLKDIVTIFSVQARIDEIVELAESRQVYEYLSRILEEVPDEE